MGSLRDVSERKDLERQLLQAQKMESVGRLAAGVAHDFNNRLTAIMGYVGIVLRQMEADNPLRRELNEVQRIAQRAANLTHQLLAFSRRQFIRPETVDLNGLIQDMYRMLRRIIGEDIELVVETAPDLWMVRVDPHQMEQVLVNLVVNARDAMPHGGRLVIRTRNATLDAPFARARSMEPGEYVTLSVSDTGLGMSPEVMEHIFEPFFSTKPPGQGTGLGLSTCYGIVKQSGGHLEVESRVGEGSTFTVFLPRARSAAAEEAPPDEGRPPRGSETILVVEDHESLRAMVSRILRDQGYRVLEASDAGEALRLAQEDPDQRIHLLLTDLVLPQMDGTQLAEKIKAMRPDIRVLYTSGYTGDLQAHQDVVQRGRPFLPKPYTIEALTYKVREVLDQPAD